MTRFTDDLSGRLEHDLTQISDQASPSSTAWEAIQHRIDEQDTTAPTMEVIMLTPNDNRLDNRKRPWLMVAAAVAALTLVAGLIITATQGDEQPIPADEPEPTLPAVDPEPESEASPTPVVLGLDLPVSVPYLDHEFELRDVFLSPLADDTTTEVDDDPGTDYVQVVFQITNPMVDFAIQGAPMGNLVQLSVPVFDEPVSAEVQLGASFPGPGESVGRQWAFPVPTGTDLSTATVSIALDGGRDGVRPQNISLAGPTPIEPRSEVVLEAESFGGPYSNGNADFEVTTSFASMNRGLYPDDRSRPGLSDRRSEQGEVFVIVELAGTSAEDAGDVVPGKHIIVTDDGVEHLCVNDAPEAFGVETVVYTASCAVPLEAAVYTFQMSSDKCPESEACPSVDHQITIDPSFTEAFDLNS